MAQAGAELAPAAGAQAVEQVEARAAGGHQGGRKAATHRQPAQPHRKHQLHHHGGPEGGQGVGADAIEAPGQIEAPLRPGDAAEAHRQAQHGGDQQGQHPQLQAGGQAAADHAEHRLLVGEGGAQLAMEQVPEVMAVLAGQGLVQAQLVAQGRAGRLRGPGAEQGIDRIARCHPQQQEHQAGDQPEHHWQQQQPAGQVGEQLAAPAHGGSPGRLGAFTRPVEPGAAAAPPPWGRRCRACKIKRPEPSNWGVASQGWAQARGGTRHTGR